MNKTFGKYIPWQITLALALIFYFLSKIIVGVVAPAFGIGGLIFFVIFLYQIFGKIKK